MSVQLYTGQVRVKDTDGQLKPIGLIVGETAETVAAVTAEGNKQKGIVTSEGTAQKNAITTLGTQTTNSVSAKGAEVLASIPSNYTTLSNDVTELKEDIAVLGLSIDEDGNIIDSWMEEE